jgi:purine-nucleoside/S-methyl-5'-thioadenosine phosphorylase / adenosine deaminase
LEFTVEQGIYLCPGFAEFTWQRHGFGSRQANPTANVTLRQIHSNHVRSADHLGEGHSEGDALVTSRPGQSIGVRTADCVPILLLDSRSRAVAAVHAGWRGTAAQIVRCTLAKITEDYGTSAGDVYAAIGPAIRACCYEVSSDVAERFASWPESVQLSATAKPRIDLAKANRLQMVSAGVPREQIFDCELCTACRFGTFFSFRREPADSGRMLSVISRI